MIFLGEASLEKFYHLFLFAGRAAGEGRSYKDYACSIYQHTRMSPPGLPAYVMCSLYKGPSAEC